MFFCSDHEKYFILTFSPLSYKERFIDLDGTYDTDRD